MKFISEEKLKQLLREAWDEGRKCPILFEEQKEAQFEEVATRLLEKADRWD